LDLNANGIKDQNDSYLFQQEVKMTPDNISSYTSIFGNYKFEFTNFSHKEIFPIYDENLWSITTDSSSYKININRDCIDGFDFGLEYLGEDVSADLNLATGFPRCFDVTANWITVRNTGFLELDGKVEFTIDDKLSFVNATPEPDGVSGNTYYWNIENLAPFQNTLIKVDLEYPGVDQIGSLIDFEVLLKDNNDALIAYDSWQEEIRCSYDPNDKQCIPTGEFVDNFSLREDALEYLIRFENLGNDTAFNIVVIDTIDNWLDLNSFELISSSHSVSVNKRQRVIKFIFENIQLPYTEIDPIGSNGFVNYSIRPKEGIPEEQLIENKAYIYFDYNPAIITNTTENIIVENLPTAVSEINRKTYDCMNTIKPNPIESKATLLIQQEFLNGELSLFDTNGRKVNSMPIFSNELLIERNDLVAGIYIYKLEKNEAHCFGKLLIH